MEMNETSTADDELNLNCLSLGVLTPMFMALYFVPAVGETGQSIVPYTDAPCTQGSPRFHTMSFCGALLCLLTEMAVLLCAWIAFTGVSERLSSSNTSLGDRLGASTRTDGGIVLAHCSQNVESIVNVAEFLHGCCRQVVGVFPDE